MFGDRLKKLRAARKLRQEDIANILGIARTTYAMYEQNSREPDFDILQQLAEYYDVTVDYLLTGQHVSSSDSYLSPEEREFLDIIRDDPNSSSFFYDFAKAPEDQRQEMIRTWRVIRELEKNRKPGQKQGE